MTRDELTLSWLERLCERRHGFTDYDRTAFEGLVERAVEADYDLVPEDQQLLDDLVQTYL